MPSTIATGYDVDATTIEQQRKVFKNPRGQQYYYALIEVGSGLWKYYKSEDGSSWTLIDIAFVSAVPPSLWIYDDSANDRLLVYSVVYGAGYLQVFCHEIDDAATDISQLWVDTDVAEATDDGIHNPVICLAGNEYLWLVWTDEFTSKGKQRAQLRAICTTTTAPHGSVPSWSTIKDIYGYDGSPDHGDGLRVNGNAALCKPSICPLTATANVAITWAYYDGDNTPYYFLKGWTGNYSGSGAPSVGTTVPFSTPSDETMHSQVAETGAASDVFVLLEDSTPNLICEKWDVSGSSKAAHGTVLSAAVDSLSLSIDKTAATDLLYAWYVKNADTNAICYKTATVTSSTWSSETSTDDNSEALGYLSSTYEDWNGDSKIQVIYTRQTNDTVRFFEAPAGATYTKSFDVDAYLLKRQTATFQTDGWLLKRQTKTWLTDAFLRYLQTKQFTTDSILLKRQTATFDADAILKVIQSKTFDADAYLTKRGTKPFDVDALLLKRQSKPFTADAILLSELSKGFTTDGWLLKRAAKTFDVDAVLRYKQTKTFDVDGWLLQRQTTSFTSDAVLRYLQTKTFTVDAQLLQRQTKAFTADAILRVLTGKAFSVDGWLLKRQTKTFDADAILAVLGVKGFTADGWLLERQTKQFTADAILRYIQTASFTTDGWLLKRATKTFSSDAWLVKAGSKGFLTDAILLKTFTKTFTSDAILQDIGVQGFTTDGWLLQRQTKQFTTDSWLLKRQTKSFAVDAILESLYHTGFTVDAWLLQHQTVTFTSDAILISATVTPTERTYGGPVARPELPVHFVYLLRKLLEDYLEYEDVPFAEKTL